MIISVNHTVNAALVSLYITTYRHFDGQWKYSVKISLLDIQCMVSGVQITVPGVQCMISGIQIPCQLMYIKSDIESVEILRNP